MRKPSQLLVLLSALMVFYFASTEKTCDLIHFQFNGIPFSNNQSKNLKTIDSLLFFKEHSCLQSKSIQNKASLFELIFFLPFIGLVYVLYDLLKRFAKERHRKKKYRQEKNQLKKNTSHKYHSDGNLCLEFQKSLLSILDAIKQFKNESRNKHKDNNIISTIESNSIELLQVINDLTEWAENEGSLHRSDYQDNKDTTHNLCQKNNEGSKCSTLSLTPFKGHEAGCKISLKKLNQDQGGEHSKIISPAYDDEIKLSSPYDPFLLKAQKIVVANLTNYKFNNAQLAKEMYMSESQLYRKIKKLTGKSTALYIRSLRLQKAKKLLTNTDQPIVEIAYQTGFSDPSYFTRTFTKEFGIAPSKLRK